jgi:ubiquinone/menaquinone biosynthesis C-methylase UbiE
MFAPEAEKVAIKERMKIALSLIEKKGKGKRLLELGCGTGELLFELKKRGFDVIGIDIFPSVPKEYNLKVIKRDLNKKLPFKGSTFDVVVAIEVLEHLFNPFFMMKEIRRVLKRGWLRNYIYAKRLFNYLEN